MTLALHRMPALFLGHGSPLNAVEDNAFSRGWSAVAGRIPRPRSVLCISAHWETDGVCVTAAARHGTIHDFRGFPRQLYEIEYPAPGDAGLARRVAALLGDQEVAALEERGLDHGAWGVLRLLYPDADVPLVQLSLDRRQPPAFHLALGRRLAPLREEGVMILASGNLVHNLAMLQWDRSDGYPWAQRINARLKATIEAGDLEALVDWERLDPDMRLAVPTPEHYLPLLYVLGARQPGEPLSFFNDRVVMGAIAMTCVLVGEGASSPDGAADVSGRSPAGTPSDRPGSGGSAG